MSGGRTWRGARGRIMISAGVARPDTGAGRAYACLRHCGAGYGIRNIGHLRTHPPGRQILIASNRGFDLFALEAEDGSLELLAGAVAGWCPA